jgi:hypothetical protein
VHRADDLFCGRVDDLECLLLDTLDELVVDEAASSGLACFSFGYARYATYSPVGCLYGPVSGVLSSRVRLDMVADELWKTGAEGP